MLLSILLLDVVFCYAYLKNIRIIPRKSSWLKVHDADKSMHQQTAEYQSKEAFQNGNGKCRFCGYYSNRNDKNGGKYSSLHFLDRKFPTTFPKQRNNEYRKLPFTLAKSGHTRVYEKQSQNFSTHKGGGIKYSPEKSQITENPLHFLKKLSPSMKTPLMVHPSHPYYGLLKHGERDDDDKFHDLKRVINLSDDIRRKYIETPLLGESNEDYLKKAKINRGNGGDETKPYRQVHIEPDVFNSFESRWYQQNGPDHADKFAKIANWKRNDYESNTRQTFPKYNNFQIEHTISKKNKTFNNQSLQVDMISSQGTKFSFPKSRAISERSTNIRDTNNEFKINKITDFDTVNSKPADKLNNQKMENNIDSRYPSTVDLIGHHLMSNKLYTETDADRLRKEFIGSLVNKKEPNYLSGQKKRNTMTVSSFRSPEFKKTSEKKSTTLLNTTWKPFGQLKLTVNNKSKFKGVRTPIRSMPFSLVGDSQQTPYVSIKHGVPVNPLGRNDNPFRSQSSKSQALNIAKGRRSDIFFQNDKDLNLKILSSFPFHDIKQQDQRTKQLNYISDSHNSGVLRITRADFTHGVKNFKSNLMNKESNAGDTNSQIKYTGIDGTQSVVIKRRMFTISTTQSTPAHNFGSSSVYSKQNDSEVYFYDSGSPIQKKIFMPKNQYDSRQIIHRDLSNFPKRSSGLIGFLSNGFPKNSLDLKKNINLNNDISERKDSFKSTIKNGFLSTDFKSEGSSNMQIVDQMNMDLSHNEFARYQDNIVPLEKSEIMNTNIRNHNGLNIFQEVKKQSMNLRRMYDDDNVILKQNNFYNDIKINERTKSALTASSNRNRQRISTKFPIMLRKGRLKKDKLSLSLRDLRGKLTDPKSRLKLIKSLRNSLTARRAANSLNELFLPGKVSNVARRRPGNTSQFRRIFQQNRFPLVIDRSRLYIHSKKFPYMFLVNKRLLINKV